jgi:5-methylcytosine-specific restriction endonuclease McrA
MSKLRNGRKTMIVKLFQEQKGRCYLCGRTMTYRVGPPNTATVDHAIPKSKLPPGYAENSKNRKAACYKCNQDKADREPWEFARDNGTRSSTG